MISFKYQRERSKLLGIILRPIAEVYFEDAGGREIRTLMYIDSGADISLIPKALGETLGLELEKEDIKEITGVGNARIPVIIKKVKMRIGNVEFEARVAWALEEGVPPLLGRLNVFDRFDINFREGDKIIEFRRKTD